VKIPSPCSNDSLTPSGVDDQGSRRSPLHGDTVRSLQYQCPRVSISRVHHTRVAGSYAGHHQSGLSLRQRKTDAVEHPYDLASGAYLTGFENSVKLAPRYRSFPRFSAPCSLTRSLNRDSSFLKRLVATHQGGWRTSAGSEPCGSCRRRRRSARILWNQSGCPYGLNPWEHGFDPLQVVGRRVRVLLLPSAAHGARHHTSTQRVTPSLARSCGKPRRSRCSTAPRWRAVLCRRCLAYVLVVCQWTSLTPTAEALTRRTVAISADTDRAFYKARHLG